MSTPDIRAGEEREAPRAGFGSLLDDMRYALLSEVGAGTIYGRLATSASREDLRALLARLEHESRQVLARLRSLMESLGGRPPRTSVRRRWLASALARLTPVVGIRRVLRLCQHAEETVSCWYARYALYLHERREHALARECDELAAIKRVHGQALAAWLTSLRTLD